MSEIKKCGAKPPANFTIIDGSTCERPGGHKGAHKITNAKRTIIMKGGTWTDDTDRGDATRERWNGSDRRTTPPSKNPHFIHPGPGMVEGKRSGTDRRRS